MRLSIAVTLLYGLLLPISSAQEQELPPITKVPPQRIGFAPDYKPAQVFRNTNLVRNTNLEKGYVRETVNVVVENVDTKPQDSYFLSFPTDVYNKLGGLDVRDKKAPEKGRLEVIPEHTEPSR